MKKGINSSSETALIKNEPSEIRSQKKKRRPPPPPPGLMDDITNVAHTSILVFVTTICFLCFSTEISFFTWHPFLLTLGWALTTSEGIMFMSKENYLSRRLTRTWKLRLHWILLSLAGMMIIAGFLVAVITKNARNKEHFRSWHSIFGLLGILAFVAAFINGLPALYDAELKDYVKPNISKSFHVASGAAGFLFGSISLALGVFSRWFGNHSDNNKYIFLAAFTTITFNSVWVFQRPFLKTLRKFFKLNV